MKFIDLFNKEFLTEDHVRKTLKIFYEINLELIKPTKEGAQPQQTEPVQQAQPQQPVPQQEPVNEPVQQTQEPAVPEQPVQEPENNEMPDKAKQELEFAMSSVVTEDEVSSNEENKIIRKFEGEVSLSDSEKDNIQSFEDIIDILSTHKKDGNQVLDEFSTEVINLCLAQNFQQLKTDVDKKSKIFVEIYYGFKKDDSVGLRFNKHPNSDTLTSTMLVDNEIISSKFNLQKLNQKVSEYRNYYAKKS